MCLCVLTCISWHCELTKYLGCFAVLPASAIASAPFAPLVAVAVMLLLLLYCCCVVVAHLCTLCTLIPASYLASAPGVTRAARPTAAAAATAKASNVNKKRQQLLPSLCPSVCHAVLLPVHALRPCTHLHTHTHTLVRG